MHTRTKQTTMRRWTTIIVTLLSMTVVLVPMTQAADEVAGRAVSHTIKTEMMEVGDEPGHFYGVSQAHALTFYTKGPEIGKIASGMKTVIFDVVKGKGTFTGLEAKNFIDGSTLFVKFGGTQTPIDEGKRTAYEGTWEVTGGTGRYAGAKGSGTYKGERIGDFKTGADSYFDWTGTLTMK